MGYALLFETMLDSLLAARDTWLAPGGALLPDRASISLAGADSRAFGTTFWQVRLIGQGAPRGWVKGGNKALSRLDSGCAAHSHCSSPALIFGPHTRLHHTTLHNPGCVRLQHGAHG
jgi:hypothetical protein